MICAQFGGQMMPLVNAVLAIPLAILAGWLIWLCVENPLKKIKEVEYISENGMYSTSFFSFILVLAFPDTGVVEITAVRPGIRSHDAGGRIQIVPGAVQVEPSGLHDTVTVQVIPGTVLAYPAGHHPSVGIKVVPAAVDIFPVGSGVSAVCMAIPPAGAFLDPFRGCW